MGGGRCGESLYDNIWTTSICLKCEETKWRKNYPTIPNLAYGILVELLITFSRNNSSVSRPDARQLKALKEQGVLPEKKKDRWVFSSYSKRWVTWRF